MKKSIIALAVAGALTAPLAQADATLYGVAQFRLIDEDKQSLHAQMAKTRLGVKGTVDNDIEGLTTGFQFEWEMNNGDEYNSGLGKSDSSASLSSLRKSLVYVKGSFGQVTFGKQNNPAATYKVANLMGYNGDLWAPVGDRVGNAISYWSPDMGGFQVVAGFVADGKATTATTTTTTSTTQTVGGTGVTTTTTSGPSEDVDAYTVGGSFKVAGFKVAATHLATNNSTANTDVDINNLGLSYTMGDLYLAGSYSDVDADSASSVTDQEVILLGASYAIGKTTIYGEYEVQDLATTSTDNKKVGLGVSYALGSSANVALEVFDFNKASGAADATVLQYTLSF